MSGAAGLILGAWMVHAAAVGLLLAGAAWCLDRALGRARLPTRWVWVGALVLTAGIPAAGLLVDREATGAAPGTGFFERSAAVEWLIGPVTATETGTNAVASWPAALLGAGNSILAAGLEAAANMVPTSSTFTSAIVLLWITGSIALVALLLQAQLRMAIRRRAWPRAQLRGRTVRMAPDLGPAVVGFLRPEIVMPAWVRSLDDDQLDLVLAHEEEHLRARDPLLLYGGLAPLCLFPWNPALWWQLRRLRDAVEVDCDRRVLGRGAAASRYGQLLLSMGTRGQADILPTPALSASPSLLERRLEAMKKRSLKTTVPLALLSGFVAVGLLVLACEADTPVAGISSAEDVPAAAGMRAAPAAEDDTPAEPEARGLAEEPVFTPYDRAPVVRNGAELTRMLQETYPRHLRDDGIGGTVIVHFFIDDTGSVENAVVAEGTGHAELDEAALSVARAFDFEPAQNQSVPVPVWVQIPITFQTR